MSYLICDCETRSFLDVQEVGVYNYATHPSTEVMVFAWCVDGGQIQRWEPHKGPMPEDFRTALLDPSIKKLAWNVSFEWHIFRFVLNLPTPLNEWLDIMVLARYASLPGSLAEAGAAIGLNEDDRKIADGRRLLNKFCEPIDSGKPNLFGISKPRYRDWDSDPEDWEKLCQYCEGDVKTERLIFGRLIKFQLPVREQRLWLLDQKINSVGLPISISFVRNALDLAAKARSEQEKELLALTGIKNPRSTKQFLGWVRKEGYPYDSLNKNRVTAALNSSAKITERGRQALKLRGKFVKNSVNKLEIIPKLISSDGRIRGQFLFMGAARTGRWAAVGFQPQNMARPVKAVSENPEKAVRLIEGGLANYDRIQAEYPELSVLDFIGSNARHAIQAPPGRKIVVCDLSAIENRVLGWIAECDEILKVFRTCEDHQNENCAECQKNGRPHLDPYTAFGVKLFAEEYSTLRNQKDKRQIAKPGTLGCGYGLGPGVFYKPLKSEGSDGKIYTHVPDEADPNNSEMGYFVKWVVIKKDRVKTGLLGYAENMGVRLTPKQAYDSWQTFRTAYPEVVTAWGNLQKAAESVIETGEPVTTNRVRFHMKYMRHGTPVMAIQLPSGRDLHYVNPRLEWREVRDAETGEPVVDRRTGTAKRKKAIIYDGIGHGVGMIQEGWGPVYTYGGKLCENIVQAVSRDVLCEGLLRADEAGAEIFLHCHDEIAVLSDDSVFSFGLSDLKYCMSMTPDWAPGLPLGADGYECAFYKKE